MESMVAANMCSRPTRTFISVLAVAIGVVLMLIIGGMMSGTLNDYLNRTMSVGADFILQPSDASIFYAMTGATLPVKLAPRIKEVPGVGLVTPVLAMFDTRNFNLVFGIDPPTYNQFPGHLQMIAGRNSLENDEIIVDELYARPRHLQPGSEFMFKQHKFTVSGICRAGAAVRVFASLKTLQELNGTPDVVTFMFIKAAPGTDVNRVETALRNTLSPYGYGLTSTRDESSLLADTKMPGMKELQFGVIVVSMLLSFMVVLVAMYTTIFERTREIGILKCLGASRSFIVGMILKETVIISSLGVLVGIGISEIARKAITSVFPTLQVSMTLTEVLTACVLGILAGALGALYPAYNAARMDPVRALTYE
jgi:putative ABC transport system permease protein